MTKARNRQSEGRLGESAATLPSRRNVIGGSAALLSVITAPRIAKAAPTEKLTVRLNWSAEGVHAPFHLANQRGWFKDADLEVSVVDGNGSVTTVQLVGSGQFDIGHAALASMATGSAKGLPVISIAGFIRKSDVGLCVPKDSPWTRPSDLIGKRICYTAGSLEGPFVRPFFEKNGAPLDKITLVNVEASAKLSTYVSSNADALATAVPFFLTVLADSRPSKGILFADFGLDLPGNGLLVQQDTLKRRGDAIKRFASVMCGTWTYIFDGHEDEGVRAIQTARPQSPLSAQKLREQIDDYRPYFHTKATRDMPIGLQSADDWRKTISDMENAGVINPGSQPEKFFTNDFIDYNFAKGIIRA